MVDATNRIVMPGFIDTHHHFYQGLLRNILSNGLLDPDYNRDISDDADRQSISRPTSMPARWSPRSA